MASSTTNYNLIKPDYEDNADIKDLNDNFDTIDMAMNNKVDKEIGKGLSTNDYTTAEKTKLDNLAEIKTVGTGLNLDDNGELTATGGGSGGTTNYNDLSNKPQINGNTLSGNKTSAQLGLASASDIPTTLADLSGDSTHRTVSDTEKAAWNNKSDFSGSYNDLTNKPTIPDELSDLTEDATHRTVTDTEKSTWNSKQTALSSTQLDAVNSGIDSTKVEQIETNQNNILTINAELIDLVDSGAKNELYFTLSDLQTWNSATTTGATWLGNVCTTNGISFTVNSDGTITANGTLTSERAIFRIVWNTPNVYGGKILSGCPSGGSPSTYQMNLEQVASPWATIAQDRGNGSEITNNTSINIYVYIAVKTSVSNLTFRPMICSKAAWDVSQKYVPYGMSNAELTAAIQALQAQLANQ